MLLRATVLMLLVLALVPADLRAQRSDTLFLFVAPEGDDGASGLSEEDALASLIGARDAVRRHRSSGETAAVPTVVLLRGGLYQVSEPLVLEPRDGGTASAPVIYAAHPGERAILSGGRVIAGWDVRGDGTWTADLPEVRDGRWDFRQLYVDGGLRQRARTPNEGFYRVEAFPCGGRSVHYHTDCDRFGYRAGDIDPTWRHLEDVEVIVYHFWTDSHLPIARVDTTTRTVIFQHNAGKVYTDDFSDAGARYVVENVYEGLDAPGEWYLDRKEGRLYYKPLPGEEPSSTEVIAPVAPSFVRIEGRPLERRPVEHVVFRGLTWAYTNWDLPPGNSNDRQGSASVPAAIAMKGARNVVFENCTLENLGTFAFEVGPGSAGNRFIGNEIRNVAAGGFRIDGGTEEDHPLLRTSRNVISDNHLHHFGQVYPSAVGILLQHTDGNRVAHNHIHHGYYTGISIGWEWGYQRSVSRDNVISFNHIHDIGQGLLSDMGAIYTLGVSPGTVIRNNLIHDIESHHYGGWGIYNDEGSSHLLVEDNVVYRTKFSAYNIHFAREIVVRNNIFALARINQLSRSRVEPHKSLYFENNIVYWKDGDLLRGNWSDDPYTFHFHPKDESGTREVSETFEMDWNLYYNPHLPRDSVRFGDLAWEEWQSRGKDVHSVYARPGFRDAAAGDFRLVPGSPALDLGFRPIDVSVVGPRSRAGAEALIH